MVQMIGLNIGTDRPGVLADFYQQVLQAEPSMQTDEITEFVLGDVRLEIMKHSEVSGKNRDSARLMLNFMVDDVPAAFERVVDLGAGVVAEPYDFDGDDMHLTIATLSDPDGNYFQLISVEPA